jgi:phytoene synthase
MNTNRSAGISAELAGVVIDTAGQQESAEAVIRRHSRSFSIASRLLPSRVRAAAHALYAWCRTLDDTVDEATDAETAEATLTLLQQDLDRLRQGLPFEHPASAWIAPLVRGQLIPVVAAKELIAGMRFDLQPHKIENDRDLHRYCYHAAGTVGLMMSQLVGTRDPAAARHAIALGIAMQLTNIARDVREDAERGRSYLPGVPDPLTAEPSRVRSVVAKLLESAEQHYRVAAEGLKYLPADCRIAIRIALSSYREIGREIQRNDCRVLTGRTVVGRTRLLMALAAAVMLGIVQELRQTVMRGVRSVFFYFWELVMEDTMSAQDRSQPSTVRQAKQIAFLGLSLTSIMAAALFVMVFMNPKEAVYSYLPLLYSGVSLVFGVLFNRCAAAYD